MAVSPLALTIAYWLHMLATVIWIGGLASLSLIVIPAARKSMEREVYSTFLARVQTRLQPLSWFCLAILAVTGMFQMSANPFYQGFLAISNSWAAAILVKHLVIGLLVLTSAYMTWGILPRLQRAALLNSTGQPVEDDLVDKWQREEARLLLINLILSILVLGLTAWARSA
jgi:uncharacterized membrane protein